jgi:hypothetical protein
MKLAELREKRRQSLLRTAMAARVAIRLQASPLAEALRSWNRAAKAVNRALTRYERATDGIDGLELPGNLVPIDLALCLRACRDEQSAALEDMDAALKQNVRILQREARRSEKRAEKRAKKRARRR